MHQPSVLGIVPSNNPDQEPKPGAKTSAKPFLLNYNTKHNKAPLLLSAGNNRHILTHTQNTATMGTVLVVLFDFMFPLVGRP